MRVAPVLALIAAFLGSPVSAQEGLQRLTLRQDLLGWEGVGRLDFGGRGYCTGVLVASDLVLTAAHCLYDFDSGGWRGRDGILFRAGLRDGVAIAERSPVQAIAHPGYRPEDTDLFRRYGTDLALLRLDAPIPAATARPFAVTPPVGSGEVSVASYGMGRDGALSRERRCNVIGRQDGLLAFDCNGAPGSSGAPVFRIDGSSIRIMSIIAGGASGERNLSVGPELSEATAMLRQALARGEGLWAKIETGPRRVAPGEDRGTGGARFVRP